MKRFLVLLPVIFCFSCFNLYRINLHQTSSNTDQVAEIAPNSRIEINLYCPGCIGCFVSRTRDNDNKKRFVCNGVFVPDTSKAKSQISQLAESDSTALHGGYLFTGFCEILDSALSKKLKQNFDNVVMNHTNEEQAEEMLIPSLSYDFGRTRFSTNFAKVILTATSADSTTLKVETSSYGNISAGHLGWAIPVIVLSYPIGSYITIATLQAMSISQTNNLITQSINQAVDKLVLKLFNEYGKTGMSNWSVKIQFG